MPNALWFRSLPLGELRYISALRQGNQDSVTLSLAIVIGTEPRTQAACLHADNGVRFRIERRTAAEHFYTNDGLFDLTRASLERGLNDKLQKSAPALRIGKG